MNNQEIRNELKDKGMKQWQLAEALEISEFTLTRWFRKEISDSRKKKILDVIKDAKLIREEKKANE